MNDIPYDLEQALLKWAHGDLWDEYKARHQETEEELESWIRKHSELRGQLNHVVQDRNNLLNLRDLLLDRLSEVEHKPRMEVWRQVLGHTEGET